MSETVSFVDPTGKIRALIERKDARIAELTEALKKIEELSASDMHAEGALRKCGQIAYAAIASVEGKTNE